jgi:hypothetical protein
MPFSSECYSMQARQKKEAGRYETGERQREGISHILTSARVQYRWHLQTCFSPAEGGARLSVRRGGFISVSAQLLTSRNALKRIRRVERNAPAREKFYSEPECWAREAALQDAFKFQ